MVMYKNTYFGLTLVACLNIAPTSLLAEAALATSAPEPLEPSELQRQQAEQNKATTSAPSTSAPESLEPSELQWQQAEHNKAIAK
jgi:hypothetical protein